MHVAARGAERHADGDLACALRDQECHQAVEAKRGQEHADGPDAAGRPRRQRLRNEPDRRGIPEGLQQDDRHGRFHLRDGRADLSGRRSALHVLDEQRDITEGLLRHRHKHEWLGHVAEVAVLRVRHDAHDLHGPILVRARLLHEPLADRRTAWPGGVGERLVDNRHDGRCGAVGGGEVSALDQPRAHRLEVARGHDIPVGVDLIAPARVLVASHANAAEAQGRTLQRNHACRRNGRDAIHRPEAFLKPFHERDGVLLTIAGERHVDAGELDVGERISGIGVRDVLQGAQEERRRHDEHQRQRHLRHHERVAQPETPPVRGGVRAMQRRREVGAERLARRSESEDDRGHQRDAERERRHARVHREIEVDLDGERR